MEWMNKKLEKLNQLHPLEMATKLGGRFTEKTYEKSKEKYKKNKLKKEKEEQRNTLLESGE